MLEFIQANWKFISVGLLLVCEVILFILKKRPTIIDNSIVSQLSTWILEAEKIYKDGEDKLNYVLSRAQVALGPSFVKKEVINMVEYLLTLPEKKEKK